MKTCPHVAGVSIDVVQNTLLDPSCWSCRECNHTESCWACLSCGHVGCSRFQDSHGLAHYEATHHPIVFEINTKYCHCYKCDAYLDNDNKHGDIAALRLLVEQLQTHTISESRTRSGRLLRSSSRVKMHPRDYTSDDRVSTAAKHWQLYTIVRAFSQWRWFVTAQKARDDDDEQQLDSLPPAPGFNLFEPPSSSTGGRIWNTYKEIADAMEKTGDTPFQEGDDEGEEEYGSSTVMSGEEEEGEDSDGHQGKASDDSDRHEHDAEVGSKRKRGDGKHEHGEAKEMSNDKDDDIENKEEQQATEEPATEEANQEDNQEEEGGSGEDEPPAPPVMATPPPPPPRRAKRRKGLLADLDMDGSSLRPKAIFLSPVVRRNLVPGQTGLRNLGNTCFMNAVLQALSNTLQFRNYFVADFLPKDKKGKLWRRKTIDCLTQITTLQPPVLGDISISAEIHNIFRVVWSGRWAVVTPFALLDALWKFVPRFRNYQQQLLTISAKQDAQEFLVYLLDKLHDELASINGGMVSSSSGAKRQPETIISKTFHGELLSQVTCSQCGNVSSRKEPYLDLLLDIPIQHAAGSRTTRGKTKTSVPSCSIYDCFDSFTWPEKLTGYYCEQCKSNQDASKRLVIQTLPDVLCVVLKRFCWTTTTRAKVDTKVLFPLVGLDLSPFCSEEQEGTIFDLSSVVIHHGSGPSAGHYTAFCYHTEQGTWLHFNDSRVSVSSPQEAASAQAYMLFYQRRSASASNSNTPLPDSIPTSDALSEAKEDNDKTKTKTNNNKKRKPVSQRGSKGKKQDSDGEEEENEDNVEKAAPNSKRKQQQRVTKRVRVEEEDEDDDDDDDDDDERDVEKLSRDELKAALRKRRLGTTGTKPVLLKRLKAAIDRDNDNDNDDDDDDDDTDGASGAEPSSPEPAPKRRLAKRTYRKGANNK